MRSFSPIYSGKTITVKNADGTETVKRVRQFPKWARAHRHAWMGHPHYAETSTKFFRS